MVNWEAIGAIGEIAGAAGVIITLIYLSVQLRQSTKASRITAIQSSMENSAQFSELLLADDEVAGLFWLGLSNPESLDVASKRKFVTALNIFMRRESVAFYLHKEGVMPDHLWDSRVSALTGTLNQPGLNFYLESAADTLPKDFREYIEEISSHETTMNDATKSLLMDSDA